MDIKAAFDRVWHNGLVAKLQARGVCGRFLQWIASYLSDRRIQVVVGRQSSAEKPINASVPQGSILGPTLFLMYIDDLGDDLSNAILLYADDSTLYCTVCKDDLAQYVVSMNTDLSQMNLWGLKWKVLFAPEKCKVTTLRLNHHHHPSSLVVQSCKSVMSWTYWESHFPVTSHSRPTWTKLPPKQASVSVCLGE